MLDLYLLDFGFWFLTRLSWAICLYEVVTLFKGSSVVACLVDSIQHLLPV